MKTTTSNLDPIIVIDDDIDDIEIFKGAFQELEIENEIMCFTSGHKFYDYKSPDDRIKGTRLN